MPALYLIIFYFLFSLSLFSQSEEKGASVFETEDSILVHTQSGKPIFKYLKKPSVEANQYAPHFSRSGYIHPLYSPSGKIITGDYAVDHPHQHGLFFAWTKSIFRGKPTEFWNQKKQLGDIRYQSSKWKTDKSGKSF